MKNFMGNRKTKACILVLWVALISCRNQMEESVEMREELASVIKQSNDTVDISKLFFGEFDTMYVFPQYYPIRDIEAETGLDLEKINLSSDSEDIAYVNEDGNLFLFKKSGILKAYFLFPRVSGDFSNVTKHLYLSPEAIFVKSSPVDSAWLYLVDVKR